MGKVVVALNIIVFVIELRRFRRFAKVIQVGKIAIIVDKVHSCSLN